MSLLSPVERKNGWQLAEALAHTTPYSLQHLLDRAPWDADAVCDDLINYVRQALGEPDVVLVADVTGLIKKGAHSVGVKRQYSGTAGRIENCQVGVFLSYASRRGRAVAAQIPFAWIAGDEKRGAESDGQMEAAAPSCIPLTVPEIRKLLWHLAWRVVPDLIVVITWSMWRRRHQAVAKAFHWKRRTGNLRR